MLFVAGWDRYVTIYDDFFCQSACQRYGKYIDLNGFLRPQLHAFHWHIQLPLPPPSSLPGKRRSPGFLMGKHSAGIKHENTQISVEWQDFERRMLGFLTELSLQFFSIKIAAAKWSRGRTQANNESHWKNRKTKVSTGLQIQRTNMFFCEFFGSVSWEGLASRKIKLKKSFPDQPKIFFLDSPPSFEPRHNTPTPLTATENFPWNVSVKC